MYKYQKTHFDLSKKVISMKVKKHSDPDDSPLLNEKEKKEFQKNWGI